jgi:hypothetical protein
MKEEATSVKRLGFEGKFTLGRFLPIRNQFRSRASWMESIKESRRRGKEGDV